jgi:hypothetical protein
MWRSWLERTLGVRDGAEYAARREARGGVDARAVAPETGEGSDGGTEQKECAVETCCAA